MAVLRTGDMEATWLPAQGMVGASLGDRVLDSEYPELDGGRAFVLRGRELRVAFGAPDYPVGHAWAPAGEAFVAWEPMTAPTNALVSGVGLRRVAPGETFDATFTLGVRDI